MNPKYEIIFINHADPDFGAPHPVMAAIWLSKLGYNVLCVCTGSRNRKISENPLGQLSTFCIPKGDGLLGKIRWHIEIFLKILKLRITRKSTTIFYVAGSVVAPACFFGLLGISPRRIVYHTQDFLEPGRHPFWSFFEKLISRHAQKVLVNEINRGRVLASINGLSEMPKVIGTYLPKEWFNPKEKKWHRKILFEKINVSAKTNIKLILHLGPLGTLRGGRPLIESLRYLPSKYIMLFTGVSESDSIALETLKIAKMYNVENQIAFLGRMPFLEMLKYAAGADLGLLLYLNDGIGNFYQGPGRLTEYLSCGLPLVGSDFPGLHALIEKYSIGKVCDSTSPKSISMAIKQVIEKPSTELRKKCLKVFKRDLCYQKNSLILEDTLSALSNE